MTTIGGAIRTAILANGYMAGALGDRVFRDIAADAAPLPYVVFIDPIGDAPVLRGDGQVLYRQALVQVELYQAMASEDDVLTETMETALDGVTLPAASQQVLKCTVWDKHRFPDTEYDEARVVFTLRVAHAA